MYHGIPLFNRKRCVTMRETQFFVLHALQLSQVTEPDTFLQTGKMFEHVFVSDLKVGASRGIKRIFRPSRASFPPLTPPLPSPDSLDFFSYPHDIK